MRRRDLLIATGASIGLAATPAAAFQRVGKRKVLVFSGGQPVPVLDPHVRYDYSTRMMQRAIYDALLKYQGDPPKIIPLARESWDVSPDGLTYTFHLVDNAKFHNGDPVDAEAVRFSFERGLKLNKGVAWMLKGHLDPAGVAAPDPHTVVFKLPRPFPGFVSFIPWWFVVNPKQVTANTKNNDYGQDWLTAHEAGIGSVRDPPLGRAECDGFARRARLLARLADGRCAPARRGYPSGDSRTGAAAPRTAARQRRYHHRHDAAELRRAGEGEGRGGAELSRHDAVHRGDEHARTGRPPISTCARPSPMPSTTTPSSRSRTATPS